MSRFRYLVPTLFTFMFLVLVQTAIGQVMPSAPPIVSQPQVQQIAGHDIKPGIVPSVFTGPRDPLVMTSEVTIATQSVKVKEGDSLSTLLQSSGVNPDADALSIIFDLNPKLKNLKSVSPGDTLVMPWVQSNSPSVETALDNGQLVALVSDQQMKNELKANTTAFEQLVDRTSKERLASLDYSEDEIQRITESMDSAKKTLELLKIANYPASKMLFKQLTADLRTVSTWNLNATTSAEREKVVVAFTTFAENLSDTMAALREGGSGKVTVQVITKKSTGEIVPNLQVLSAPYLREQDPGEPFKKNSSPAEDDRPPAKYLIWATRDGTMVSDKKTVRVRSGDNRPIDLEIIR